jgi:glycosyltransferase involved in cell wall biosynthesis
MKIAFDSQIFATQHHGGISRAHARLATALAAAGEAARIIAPFHINAYLDGAPHSGTALPDSRWNRRAARLGNAIFEPLAMARFAPNIVQETYYRAAQPSARRARSVVMVYDMIHELFPDSFPAGDPTTARKAAAIARADHLLCISESTRRDLIAHHPAAAAKSSVCLLGFDPPGPGGVAFTPDRPFLLFVGQRGGYKNFAGLLAAYAASPALRAEFDLLAVGGGAFTAEESTEIARHGLGGNVHQRAADDRMLQACYAAATVFIYPSLYEGFGIPPLEAMAAGTPVVAMNASSVPEVCGPAAAYAQPDDPASLQQALESVALSPVTAAALVAAGHERLKLFSWERSAATAAAAYRGLL